VTTELVRKTEAPMVPANPASVGEILRLAVEKGASIEQMQGIIDLQERIENRSFAAEFFDAMARFQSECPPIQKTGKATKASDAGAKLLYKYATLDEIARTVNPILARCALSYSWDVAINEKAILTCVCKVRHRNGHTETSSFACPVTEQTALPLSDGQKASGTYTLAKRQSLIAALGLTTCDEDTDDGMSARVSYNHGGSIVGVITDEQAANLQALAEEVNADRTRFLAHFKIPSLAEMPAARLPEATRLLESKRKQAPK